MNQIHQPPFFPESRKPKAGSCSRGVTLIDTVVGSALMLVVFLGIFAAFQLSIDVVTNNRARAGALALMNERMEYVRSLDYASVGTVGGIPSGPIAQSEPVTLSGIPYTRRTTVQYADDPEDGENEADENGRIVDYKQVRIEMSWDSRTGERRGNRMREPRSLSPKRWAARRICSRSRQCGRTQKYSTIARHSPRRT